MENEWKSKQNTARRNINWWNAKISQRIYEIWNAYGNNNINKKTKNANVNIKKYHNLCLTTIYFLHSGYKEKELESFNSDISSFLSNILSKKDNSYNYQLTQDTIVLFWYRPHPRTPRPFRKPSSLKNRKHLLRSIMQQHQLTAIVTFFDDIISMAHQWFSN